jgi:hypothetical protein
MQKILTAFCLLTLACGADKYEYNEGGEKKSYRIKNEWLNEALEKAGESRKAAISTVEYYDTETPKIALVNYTISGEPGLYNVVVEMSGNGESMNEIGRMYYCTGISCNCLVVVTVGGGGSYELKCNCTTCDMIVVDTPQPTRLFQ